MKLSIFLIVAVLTSAMGCSRGLLPRPDSSEPLSLIIISVDTLRADHLGAYGYGPARTPIVDQLAKEGVTFEYAIAPMPRTTPALGSMLTGLWPHEHGARDVHARVERGEFVTELLHEHGFHTQAASANPAAGKRQGFATGFVEFEQLRMTDDAAKVTNETLAMVSHAPRDRPLFLWAHFFDPHTPYKAPEPWRVGSQEACDALSRSERGHWRSNFEGVSERALPDCTNAYDAEIAFTDFQVGRLIKGLKESRRLDNAIVVFTSDHGENLGEWGSFFGHGVNVHDAAVRVPLIIAGAGIKRGARVNTPIGLHDVAPTLLALAGVPETRWPKMSGADYSQAVRNDGVVPDSKPLALAQSGGVLLINDHTAMISGRPRTGYCVNKDQYSLCWKGTSPPRLHDRTTDPERRVDIKGEQPKIYDELAKVRTRWKPDDAREQSVSDGRFKLVERPRYEGGFSRELYDLRSDPAETIDVKDQRPGEFTRLAGALDAWTVRIPGYQRAELSPDEEAQLRALGYIE